MCACCDTQRNVPVTIHSPAEDQENTAPASRAEPVRVTCGEELIIALQYVRVTANNICLISFRMRWFQLFHKYINGIAQHESNHYGEEYGP
jgi:hypothetical protein